MGLDIVRILPPASRPARASPLPCTAARRSGCTKEERRTADCFVAGGGGETDWSADVSVRGRADGTTSPCRVQFVRRMIAPSLTSRFVHPDVQMLTCIAGWGGITPFRLLIRMIIFPKMKTVLVRFISILKSQGASYFDGGQNLPNFL